MDIELFPPEECIVFETVAGSSPERHSGSSLCCRPGLSVTRDSSRRVSCLSVNDLPASRGGGVGEGLQHVTSGRGSGLFPPHPPAHLLLVEWEMEAR